MEKRKIIIDTDPGIDDAYALITAMKYEGFDVMGITTVAGNKGLSYTTDNALKLVHLLQYDTMVYAGAKYSLGAEKEEEDAGDTHGVDGLGGVHMELDRTKLADTHAVDFILESVKANPHEVELITLGPLTNIAMAIQKDPETMKKVKAIYSMGGGIHRGNMTPVAEFNYWFDPKAVEITFELGKEVPVHMIGLDITHKTVFTCNDLFFMEQEGGKIGQVLKQMSDVYVGEYWKQNRYTGCVIHDLVTVIYAIHPEICNPEKIHHSNLRMALDGLSRGQTIVDLVDSWKLPKNAIVPMEIDARAMKEKFIGIVFPDKSDMYQKHVIS